MLRASLQFGFGFGALSSTEVFTVGEAGWRLEPKLEMGSTKSHHCSVAIRSWLYTTRGDLGEESEYDFQWMDARMPHWCL